MRALGRDVGSSTRREDLLPYEPTILIGHFSLTFNVFPLDQIVQLELTPLTELVPPKARFNASAQQCALILASVFILKIAGIYEFSRLRIPTLNTDEVFVHNDAKPSNFLWDARKGTLKVCTCSCFLSTLDSSVSGDIYFQNFRVVFVSFSSFMS